MSTCIKDFYDYDSIKKCRVCKNYSVKSSFNKNTNFKDGLQTQRKFCVNDYNGNFYNKNGDSELERPKKYESQNRGKINEYNKNKMKTDLHCKLATYMRNRLYKAYNAQNVRKTNKTFDLLGCSHSFFKNWIIHQLYGNITLENYVSVWQLDQCPAVASFNLLDEKAMKKCFNWINSRPMHTKDIIIKGDKIGMRLYLLQVVKANYFLKLNVEEVINDKIRR